MKKDMKDFKKSKAGNGKKKFLMELWKRRIVEEKGVSETAAEQIALRVKALAEYMQYGHAIIAYYKQDGTFQLVTATLIPYLRAFRHPFDIQHVHGSFVYWNIEAEGWRTFQIENFLEWKEIV